MTSVDERIGMNTAIIKPKRLNVGDTIGVFTPSSPGYIFNEGLFSNGLRNLERMGFKVKLGGVTQERRSQGYRSASAEDRAKELMDLIRDPDVHGLMSTIGGYNSSSLIPYLDFERIRAERKPFCGYSDVTSLHAAILKFSGLRTYYGPSVMCWLGDWPDGDTESIKSFLAATGGEATKRELVAPKLWSNHKRRWDNDDWKTIPREWKANEGWKVQSPGFVEAPILALNLNTLLSAAGTQYWPDFEGKILLIEDMDAPQSRSERSLRQLSLIGVFDQIKGLIVSKPEFYEHQDAPFSYEELIQEVVGRRPYPIVTNFDCGHTLPMITIPQLSLVRLKAPENGPVEFSFLETAFEEGLQRSPADCSGLWNGEYERQNFGTPR